MPNLQGDRPIPGQVAKKIDRRVASILVRLHCTVVERRAEEGAEVAALLVEISLDPQRPLLHAQLANLLLNPAAEQFAMRRDLAAKLKNDLEAEADRYEILTKDYEESKSGTWNYAIAGPLGTGIATLLTPAPLLSIPFLALAAGAFFGRKRAHARQRTADLTARGLRALSDLLSDRISGSSQASAVPGEASGT